MHGTASYLHNRAVRVFVSSTFRDMHAEREELVKFVFPQLRKLCEQRGVSWGEVDLRWGITDEQRAEGSVLPLCMAEIERCSPFFIGILGDRYGWVPDAIPPELAEQDPRFEDLEGTSVTEMEVVRGVLGASGPRKHAFFYMRDPEASRTVERTLATVEDYQADTARDRESLARLKERIEQSGYPVRTGFRNAKELGRLVLKDQSALIDQLFPESTSADASEREAFAHATFAASRSRVFIGRAGYLQKISQHVDEGGSPLVVSGRPGSGKSALLATWSSAFSKARPHTPVIAHYVGATQESTAWQDMLVRIMMELQHHHEMPNELPETPEAIKAGFANWLHLAGEQGRTVVIIDGVDQLDESDGAMELSWLPTSVPDNIRLILSASSDGRVGQECARRRFAELLLDPLTVAERKLFVDIYLRQYSKRLSEPLADRIATDVDTENPLFLRVLLEELRQFGEHFQLQAVIETYLQSVDVSDLYAKVLGRYEKDYEASRPGLVKDAMSLIAASHRGLHESELLTLLGDADEPLPHAIWSPLYLAAQDMFISHGGRLTYANPLSKQAVENRYLGQPDAKLAVHQRLARHFERDASGRRQLDELPWQYVRTQSWPELYERLRDADFIGELWFYNQFEALSYWAQLEEASEYRMKGAYAYILATPESHLPHLTLVAHLLHRAGHFEQALALYRAGEFEFTKNADDLGVVESLSGQGATLQTQRELDEALAIYERLMSLPAVADDLVRLHGVAQREAGILMLRGQVDRALETYDVIERQYRAAGNLHGLCSVLFDKSQALMRKRNRMVGDALLAGDVEWQQALNTLDEAEGLCRQLGNKALLAVALGHKAMIWTRHLSRPDLALEYYREEESIYLELGDKVELQWCLGRQSLALLAQARYNDAFGLSKKQRQLCEELGLKSGLAASLSVQAAIMEYFANPDGALTLLEEQERLLRALDDKDELAVSLQRQAAVLRELGEEEAAMRLDDEVAATCATANLTTMLHHLSRGN